jgi:hypothetical protein
LNAKERKKEKDTRESERRKINKKTLGFLEANRHANAYKKKSLSSLSQLDHD